MDLNMLKQRKDSLAIWNQAVQAVNSSLLVQSVLQVNQNQIQIGTERFSIDDIGRIAVVGGGKGGAGMAAGFEKAVAGTPWEFKLSGLLNVPEDCMQPTQQIELHAARPAGVNVPTEAGVWGTARILEIVRNLEPNDLMVALICGGGSALLPAPIPEISLEEKQYVTKLLMNSGASIDQLNRVRQHLSVIKGGGLLKASNSNHNFGLIISDIVDDPLDLIASGPTVPPMSTMQDAIETLRMFLKKSDPILESILSKMKTKQTQVQKEEACAFTQKSCTNLLIGNNATALTEANLFAKQLGYRVESLGSNNEGIACEVGRDLAMRAVKIQKNLSADSQPVCLLSGGEPIVQMVETNQPRKGGRNQEVAVAAVQELWKQNSTGIVVLSGGTDGEDGPTDAAGGLCDERVIREAKQQGLEPRDFLAINNTYPFLEQTDGLIKTGPTHTNVMDVRVVLIGAKNS